jgi:hypothetical protein
MIGLETFQKTVTRAYTRLVTGAKWKIECLPLLIMQKRTFVVISWRKARHYSKDGRDAEDFG